MTNKGRVYYIAKLNVYLDGLVQERRNSIANPLKLRLSCTNLSICNCKRYIS